MKTVKISLFVAVVVGSLIWVACSNSSTEKKGKVQEIMEKVIVDFENQEVIQLNKPNLDRDFSLMRALNERKSLREYSVNGLDLTDLSDLLWAANGVNRPESGKRTAPSAINAQDVDVYVCTQYGAYLYNAQANTLNRVTTENLIPAVAAGQDFVLQAPVSLVLVSDLSRFGDIPETHTRLLGAMDVGIVSQNIDLFCVAAGMATVPRASMDVEALQRGLNLSEKQIPMMNNPVGYTK